MKIFDCKSGFETIGKGYVLSIGNFDGVHLGHQAILAAASQAVSRLGAPGLAVMIFDPHPAGILAPDNAPGILTPLAFKKHLLASFGVDCLIVLKDSYELLNLSPADFVDGFLMRYVKPAAVVEGPNFNFGYGRSGNIRTMKKLGTQMGFKVIEVPAQLLKIDEPGERRGVMCSSSLIRTVLSEGKVSLAKELLGRFYRLMGRTVKGRGIGGQIGFPTANIDPLGQIVPAEGVYAGFVGLAETLDELCAQQQRQNAVFSIGRAKTFVTDHPLLVEAHILETIVPDLAGKYLAMDFVERLRPQRRFESREKLADQIAIDCEVARDILCTD